MTRLMLVGLPLFFSNHQRLKYTGNMGKRKTTSQFIAEAKAVHGDRYDYSKVDYKTNRDKVCIICPEHGEFWQRPSDHLSGKYGCPKCARIAVDSFRDRTKNPFYPKWCGMRRRCNEKEWMGKYNAYVDCVICDEWDSFESFCEWAENPANGYIDGYHLDKDLLVKGNRVYSPNTCCFVPQEINSLVTNCRKKRGVYPIGVSKSRNTYLAHLSCYSTHVCIGSFKTPEEAFQAYKHAKEQYVKELAESYFKEGKITEKVYHALMKYEVEITD